MYTFALTACALIAIFSTAAIIITTVMERTVFAGITDEEGEDYGIE